MTYNPLLQRHDTQPDAAKVRDPDTGATRCVKDVFQAAVEGDVECLKANLDLGVDINKMGQPARIWGPRYEKSGLFYATPLHYACSYNREVAVRFLISRGARTDLRSASGLTCKEYARRRNYVNILLLLDRGVGAQSEDAARAAPAVEATDDAGVYDDDEDYATAGITAL